MSSKRRKLKLTSGHINDSITSLQERFDAPRLYQVIEVTNSAEFTPGMKLTKEQVADLCEITDWDIVVVS